MDDTFALDGGAAARKWAAKHAAPKSVSKPREYQRPHCIRFPVQMYFRIKSLAEENGLCFTAQVIAFCEKGLDDL